MNNMPMSVFLIKILVVMGLIIIGGIAGMALGMLVIPLLLLQEKSRNTIRDKLIGNDNNNDHI